MLIDIFLLTSQKQNKEVIDFTNFFAVLDNSFWILEEYLNFLCYYIVITIDIFQFTAELHY